jgi:hypothetical protein
VDAHFTGSLPVSADTFVRLTQRNVIITRADLDEDRLAVTNPQQGNFALGCR